MPHSSLGHSLIKLLQAVALGELRPFDNAHFPQISTDPPLDLLAKQSFERLLRSKSCHNPYKGYSA